MGRPPLSEEQNAAVKIRLIDTVRELLDECGLKCITIRSVAARMGVNSAIIYKYFTDLDELVVYACVDYLKSYIQELTEAQRGLESGDKKALYLLSWRLFCRYAFRYPQIYSFLFFGRHSGELSHIVEEYYKLYPRQLEGLPTSLHGMILATNLKMRNMEVLQPLLEGSASKEETAMINDITVASFRSLLSEMLDEDCGISAEAQGARMMGIAEYLIS